jgi:hypothetical protein
MAQVQITEPAEIRAGATPVVKWDVQGQVAWFEVKLSRRRYRRGDLYDSGELTPATRRITCTPLATELQVGHKVYLTLTYEDGETGDEVSKKRRYGVS